jgi:hypothetical protein
MAGKVKEAAKGPLWLASFPDERLEQLAHALTDAKAVVAQPQGVDTAGPGTFCAAMRQSPWQS